jgi:hypothetical protein
MSAAELQHLLDSQGPFWHVLLGGGNGVGETRVHVPRLLVAAEVNEGVAFDLLFTFKQSPILFHARLADVRLTFRSDGVPLLLAAHIKRSGIEPARLAPIREPEVIADVKRWERDAPRAFALTRLYAEEHRTPRSFPIGL